MNQVLNEAKRLHHLGAAVHWLRPKSKVPLESGWTTGPRKPWPKLQSTYAEGLNVGVLLGEASKIGDNYLCCIDVDVKDPAFKKDALAKLFEITGGREMPTVLSGSGNGSRHLYCVTSAPFKMKTVAKVANAWEICIYSSGRQMVLPPSTHPDTGKAYSWFKEIEDEKSLPLMDFDSIESVSVKRESKKTKPVEKSDDAFKFEVQDIQLDDVKVSDKMKAAILKGEGVLDRSGYLLPACAALVRSGLTRDEVLTVLTEPDTFLGACSYDHAKTSDRTRAAHWLWRYTLSRVMAEQSAKNVFASVPIESKALSDEEAKEQNSELVDWTLSIERSKDFGIRSTLKNCKLILENTFGKDCFRMNEFSMTEEMHGNFPWTEKRVKEAYDIDVTMAKDWFAKTWGFEPADEKIRAAISVIAFENRYHPVKKWLEALPRWDEVDRIDNLLSKYIPCKGDEELKAVAGRRFLVALVKRIYEPGCQSDQLLVLEGAQGIYKSSAFRALVGDDWFSDASFNVEDKDAVMVIFSKWLIEFGELSTLDRATAEHTKAFITRRSDRIRAPFDRKAKDYPRQCLFVGSTNKDEYLKDDTGNRRYWPFRVESDCRVDLIKRDREQLFAEALYYYQIGEVTYLKEPHLNLKMKEQQSPREMHDVLTEHIESVAASLLKSKPALAEGFTMHDLFETGRLSGLKLDQYSTQRIGSALRKLGFTSKVRREGANLKRVWVRIVADVTDCF